jgi:PAS domain S-box-containing protein
MTSLRFTRKRYDQDSDREELRKKIIGLGEKSFRKSYYPELRKRLADLERFKALLNQSTDAIFLLETPSGRFTGVTVSACRQIGYTEDVCLTMTMYDLIPDSSKELSRLLSGEIESIALDTSLIKGNGERMPCEVNMRRVSFDRRDYVVAVARDITRRRQIQESLRLTQFALDEFSDSAIWTAPDGKIVYVNETTCRRLGYSRGELLAMHIWDIDLDYGPEKYKESWKEIKREGGTRKFESHHVTRDGKKFPVEVTCSYISYGNKEYIISFDRDITERKRAEEERENLLREIDEQRQQLQIILDTLPVSLFIVDTCGRIVFANHIARAEQGGFFPHTIEELANIGIRWADSGKPFNVEDSGLTRALRKGETTAGEVLEIKRSDGSRIIKISSTAPLFNVRGKITGAMVTSLDITEMRQLEKELDKSRQQAELYLDLMSHDITNMNQALMGYLEIIEAMRESGEIDKGLIDNSIEIINRSTRMINDVKKLTRIGAGKVPLKNVDVCEILSAVKSRYLNVPGRPVTINYAPGKNCIVRAGDLLRDVFDNLVDNAIRHSTGPVTVDLAIDQVNLEGRCYYRVSVADNGPGISPDLKKKIFMTQDEIREKTVRRGFGMYMVRTLIDYFHGQVWAEDRVPGDFTKGAKFVVLLPQEGS